jgi:hypothetical protein
MISTPPQEEREARLPLHCRDTLRALVSHPGARARDLGDPRAINGTLRRLRSQGLALSSDILPRQWWATDAGHALHSRIRRRDLQQRQRARHASARHQQERAEALWEFADGLLAPTPPALCPQALQPRGLSFSELHGRLVAHLGREVLVAVTQRDTWPSNPAITIVGTLERIEKERDMIDVDHPDDLDDVLVAHIGDGGFVHVSRRHFTSAQENGIGDLLILQGSHEMEVWVGL